MSNPAPLPAIVAHAKAFATNAHGDQVRKYTGEPYWHHCQEVAELVSRLTDDPEVIAAAWLHDVIEDTPVGYGQLAELFGWRVACYVQRLTDEFTHSDYPAVNRAARKRLEAKRLGSCSSQVRLIKLCDVQSNAPSIEEHGGDFAEVWRKEKAYLVHCLLRGPVASPTEGR